MLSSKLKIARASKQMNMTQAAICRPKIESAVKATENLSDQVTEKMPAPSSPDYSIESRPDAEQKENHEPNYSQVSAPQPGLVPRSVLTDVAAGQRQSRMKEFLSKRKETKKKSLERSQDGRLSLVEVSPMRDGDGGIRESIMPNLNHVEPPLEPSKS